MKIVSIGGGPGGLYASLLLKKANPANEVTVVERNPRGATYGFGVVLSDRTLTSFREADYKTFLDITQRQVLWNAIDVRFRGTTVRSGGHTFAGIARKTLLGLLEDRCLELGVEIRHEIEIGAVAECEDADLILAADGLHSLVRNTYLDVFQPAFEYGRLKYIWLGTHHLFDAFTFIFHENEHGVFQAHAYPYDGTSSTVVIMCDEATWSRAGLDTATEAETVAYCETVFREDLQGRRLMSNNSKWISFGTLRNRTWFHKNIALLGDAAHTVHFTIGSGTKLAMEDAIGLANAVERHGDDIKGALADYELERQPILDRFQSVAGDSESYFEDIGRYMRLDPLQFAFQLLTRGPIDYENLRQRDPYLVDAVDRWYAHPRGQRPVVGPPPVLTPLQLRGLTLANRVAQMAPPPSGRAGGGFIGEDLMSLARGAPGVVISPVVAVSPEGRITPADPGLYQPDHEARWRTTVEAIHAESPTAVALQLGHAGPRGATRSRDRGLDRPLQEGGWPLLSASPVPYTDRSRTPKQMDREDMDRVRDAFAEGARLAAAIGVDLLLLHSGHGYLLASFLSPLTNRRTDNYGGSLENRMRFPLEVFEAVRAAWPEERPVGAAITVTDWQRGGFDVESAVVFARELRARGCDVVHPLAGQTTPAGRPAYGRAYLAAYGDRLRNEAGVCVLTGGNITTTSQMNTLLAAARADLCILDEGLRRDFTFPA